MSSIYVHKRRGNIEYQIKYVVWFPDGTKKDKFRYVKTKSEANDLCRHIDMLERGSRSCNLSPAEIVLLLHYGLLSVAECIHFSRDGYQVEYNLEEVIGNYRLSNSVSNTPGSHAITMRLADRLCIWIKGNPIPGLTDTDVKKYIAGRKTGEISHENKRSGYRVKGVSAKTIRNELDVLRAIIDEAVKLKMVKNNVARGVSAPLKNSKLRRSCKTSEIPVVLDALEKNCHLLYGQIRELVLLALYTGMRRAELRVLCWEDIDLDTRKITVQAKKISEQEEFTPKSGIAETITIPDRLAEILRNMERTGRYVFGGDSPYNIDVISQAVKRVMERAGLPQLSLHTLRHTYCSWLLKKTGGDLKFVQGAARHQSLQTTYKYLHEVSDIDDPARDLNFE